MAREVKQGRRGFPDGVSPSGGSPASATSSPSSSPPPRSAFAEGALNHRAATVVARWFEALDPAAPPAADPRLSLASSSLQSLRRAAAPVVLIALAVLAEAVVLRAGADASRAPALLALLPMALALVAGALVVRGVRGLRRQRRAADGAELVGGGSGHRHGAARGVEVDGERLAFRSTLGRAPHMILHLDAPFGVTLLASPRRERVTALLSSASGTFYLGAAFDAPSRRAFAPLLDRAFTVVGDDVGLEAIAPDGEPLLFSPEELASLLDALLEQSPTCLERFVLTDARGAALTLDGRHLCAGERSVDLNAPLEWKPIVFQEAFGQAVAVYQGTWIRQGGTEMTLVSLLPALGPVPGSDLDAATLDRGVLRDLRLMQASPEVPPPSEQRVAIERLFMLPVRSALDRAPRASHQPDRAQA